MTCLTWSDSSLRLSQLSKKYTFPHDHIPIPCNPSIYRKISCTKIFTCEEISTMCSKIVIKVEKIM